MVFSSATFLFVFFPAVLVLYFVLPGRKAKNVVLLIASLFFYAWGEPVYVLLMLFSITFNWVIALFLGKADKQTSRRVLLVVACVVNVLVIGFFKYEGFVADNLNAVIGADVVPNLELPLPIGISFYTLQALSYVIDVYRKEVEPQRNILYLGMYISCFPQLIAGPIVRYQTIQDQVLNRKETLDGFSSGLRLFIVGLAKKVLLANTVAILANSLLEQGAPVIGAIGAWGGVLAYTFQIYFDFSGYSDMAIGIGRMMGFTYLRNFNYPYISRSITEFWRRWHISLSTFFRDYIYIPLGGSRVSTRRWLFNIMIVWSITGLWHGAAWNYILWGVYYGVLLIAEKMFLSKVLNRLPAFVQHLYVIFVFMIGWTFFWITDPEVLFSWFAAMFGAYGILGTSTLWETGVWQYWPVFALCAVASTPIAPFVKERFAAFVEQRKPKNVSVDGVVNPKRIESVELCVFSIQPADEKRMRIDIVASVVYDAVLLVLLVLSSMSIVSGSFNPFIYFQF